MNLKQKFENLYLTFVISKSFGINFLLILIFQTLNLAEIQDNKMFERVGIFKL